MLKKRDLPSLKPKNKQLAQTRKSVEVLETELSRQRKKELQNDMDSAITLDRGHDESYEDLLSSIYPHSQEVRVRRGKGFVIEDRCDTALEQSNDQLEQCEPVPK